MIIYRYKCRSKGNDGQTSPHKSHTHSNGMFEEGGRCSTPHRTSAAEHGFSTRTYTISEHPACTRRGTDHLWGSDAAPGPRTLAGSSAGCPGPGTPTLLKSPAQPDVQSHSARLMIHADRVQSLSSTVLLQWRSEPGCRQISRARTGGIYTCCRIYSLPLRLPHIDSDVIEPLSQAILSSMLFELFICVILYTKCTINVYCFYILVDVLASTSVKILRFFHVWEFFPSLLF